MRTATLVWLAAHAPKMPRRLAWVGLGYLRLRLRLRLRLAEAEAEAEA